MSIKEIHFLDYVEVVGTRTPHQMIQAERFGLTFEEKPSGVLASKHGCDSKLYTWSVIKTLTYGDDKPLEFKLKK